jgi:hypothetical protein
MKVQRERPLFSPLATRADAAGKSETPQEAARPTGTSAAGSLSGDRFAASAGSAPSSSGYTVPKSLTRASFSAATSTGGASTVTATSTSSGAQQLEQDLQDLQTKKSSTDSKVRKAAEDDERALVAKTEGEIIQANNRMKELAKEEWSQNPAAALEYAQLALEVAEKHTVLSGTTALESRNQKKLVEGLNGTQKAVDQIKTTLADKAASEVTDPDAKAALELARTALGI